MVVELRKGGDGCVCKARDQDVLVFVLPNWQILGTRRQKVKHLKKTKQCNDGMRN